VVWTEERVELAKSLWKDGESASEIAGRLGGVTRNAVIGKLHRMGLSSHAMGRKSKKSDVVNRSYRQKRYRFRFGTPESMTEIPSTPLPAPMQTDIARISFNDLDDIAIAIPLDDGTTRIVKRHCKFRIPNTPPDCRAIEYCGDQRMDGLPYCESHAKRAYGAPPPRQYKNIKPGDMLIRVVGGMKFEEVS
jgi:GcrA cell cycle regulator